MANRHSNEKSLLTILIERAKDFLMLFVIVSVFYAVIFFLLTLFHNEYLILFQPEPLTGMKNIITYLTETEFVSLKIGFIGMIKTVAGFSSGVYLIALYMYLSEFRKRDRNSEDSYSLTLIFCLVTYLVGSIIIISVSILVPFIANHFSITGEILPEFQALFYLLPIIWLIIAFMYPEENRLIPLESMKKDIRGFWFITQIHGAITLAIGSLFYLIVLLGQPLL